MLATHLGDWKLWQRAWPRRALTMFTFMATATHGQAGPTEGASSSILAPLKLHFPTSRRTPATASLTHFSSESLQIR